MQVQAEGVLLGAAVDLNTVRTLCRRLVKERGLHSMSAPAVLAAQLNHWSGNQVWLIQITLLLLICAAHT